MPRCRAEKFSAELPAGSDVGLVESEDLGRDASGSGRRSRDIRIEHAGQCLREFEELYHLEVAMWSKPAYTEMRFGFEVTMYIANR
jgi:coenzyme PQQ precursor peptide PqqA